MIPEAAVEAAAKAALGRYLNKATIQLILEAAAPHMLSHERQQTADAHRDAVVNAETVDRLEKELEEAEDNCCCGNCGL